MGPSQPAADVLYKCCNRRRSRSSFIHSVAATEGNMCISTRAGSSCCVWHSVENDFPLKVLNVRIWCVILNVFQVNETEMFSCFHSQKFYPSVQKCVRVCVCKCHTRTHTLQVIFFSFLSTNLWSSHLLHPRPPPSLSPSANHSSISSRSPGKWEQNIFFPLFFFFFAMQKKKRWSNNRCKSLF